MDGPTPEDWLETNGAMWDERVPVHAAGESNDIPAFRAGRDPLRPFELAEVGDVTGKSLLHLQCRIGLDTLSWARHGAARVVGLDVSEPAVDVARDVARDLGLGQDRAAFVAADVYDAASAVPDPGYDIVYTGMGALRRLPDLERWADTAASLVAPGGFLYVAEFHPLTDVLDDATGSRVEHDYFHRDVWIGETPGGYGDFTAETVDGRGAEWQHHPPPSSSGRGHPVGEVVSAVAAAGLRVDFLHEHDVTAFQRFASLKGHDDGGFRFPAGSPRIPLMYSLKASRPRG